MKSNPMPNRPRAIAVVRDYAARKFLLATALLIGTYLALVPIFHRLAD